MEVFLLRSTAFAADKDGTGFDNTSGKFVGEVKPGDLGTALFVHSIPVPGSPQCCQFVATGDWKSGTLFVDDFGGTIFELDATTGAILNSFPNAGGNMHGLAWDGRYLIQNGYNTYTSHFTDKDTGALSYSQPSTGGYGIAWGKCETPYDDQWLWTADHNTNLMSQDNYYTGASAFTFANAYGSGQVGSMYDGINIWDTAWSASILQCYNVSGAPITSFSAPYNNPRDGCWDGHFMWTIHWENTTAYKLDLYQEAGLYPVTGCLLPRHVSTSPGSSFTVEVSLMNHSTSTMQKQVWLQAEQVGGGISHTVAGPINVSLAAGQFLEVDRRITVPNSSAYSGLWDIYVRVGTFPNAEHQGGIVVDVQ